MKTALLLCTFLLAYPFANCSATPQDDEKVYVVLGTSHGKVAWSDIVTAVSKEVGFEVPALAQAPAGDFDINAPSARLVMYGMNKMLLPSFRISVDRSNDTVVVRVNQTKLAVARKEWDEARRARASAADEAAGQVFGLRPFREDAKLDEAARIVVLVHGFNSSTRYMGALATQIEKVYDKKDARCQVALFDYAAREGSAAAAVKLEQELSAIAKANPKCAVSLVTHSMGGIVARLMIESDTFELSQIKRVVMVAPPNHGTNLASLPSDAGIFDSFLGQVDRAAIRQMLQALVAEANLAIDELRPDSELLKELNLRDRNVAIEYSILLGKSGIVSSRDSKLLDQLAMQLRDSKQVELAQAGHDLAALKGLVSPEIVAGQGDGVVSLTRGKLEGVADIEVFNFQHSDLLKDDAKTQRRIIREILERLK